MVTMEEPPKMVARELIILPKEPKVLPREPIILPKEPVPLQPKALPREPIIQPVPLAQDIKATVKPKMEIKKLETVKQQNAE